MQPSQRLLSAFRNVTRQIHRSRAALTAIAFGVVAMILATGFIDWNLRFGRDNTIESQLGHLQLMKPGFLENGRADPYAYLLPPAGEAERAAVQALPGYQRSAPRLLVAGLASSGEITLSFIGEGVTRRPRRPGSPVCASPRATTCSLATPRAPSWGADSRKTSGSSWVRRSC